MMRWRCRGFAVPWAIVLLCVLMSEAAAPSETFEIESSECYEGDEDVDMLEFSLLQTSLQLSHIGTKTAPGEAAVKVVDVEAKGDIELFDPFLENDPEDVETEGPKAEEKTATNLALATAAMSATVASNTTANPTTSGATSATASSAAAGAIATSAASIPMEVAVVASGEASSSRKAAALVPAAPASASASKSPAEANDFAAKVASTEVLAATKSSVATVAAKAAATTSATAENAAEESKAATAKATVMAKEKTATTALTAKAATATTATAATATVSVSLNSSSSFDGGDDEDEVLLFAHPVSFLATSMMQLSRNVGFHGSFVSQSLSRAVKHEAANSIPTLLVFMFCAVICTVFFIQLLSVLFHEPTKDPDADLSHRMMMAHQHHYQRDPRYSYGSPQHSLPPHAFGPPSSRSLGPPSARDMFAMAQTPVMPLTPSSSSMPPQTLLPYSAQSVLHGGGQERRLTTSSALSSQRPRMSHEQLQAVKHDALGPSLINPHGEATFLLSQESLKKLVGGYYPVEILGPSGKPLLHARLPVAPPTETGSYGAVWLELSTTADSRFPHASVGPLTLGTTGTHLNDVKIRGPRGETWGNLGLGSHGGWQVHRTGGHLKLDINVMAEGYGLEAVSPEKRLVSGAAPADGKRLQVKVSPGVDALLSLISLLAIILSDPELAGVL
eukprot:TRINITY_DN10302_c0_g3_i1.p1 TRINITY_DN10302_c0_g3~~TRINITY_DN10302_c0_g3_i1.p1  ORF type:complete len:676 (-),score=164.43 TRINITY_DN10302_c0_g3_i1:125-2152(-)